MPAIATPCIGICRIEATSDLCIGCGRSGAEIGSWREMNDEDRQVLMASLPDRFAHVPALRTARDAFDASQFEAGPQSNVME